MEKVLIQKAGGYDRLQFVTSSAPKPASGEVLIDVAATGVNYADVLVRMGVYESAKTYVGWPITPGFEVSGEVSAIGSLVSDFKIGDKVVAITRFNGYATQVAVPEKQVMKLPKGFQLEEAAGFPAVFITAMHAIRQCIYIPPKATVLVHSAAGGVGTALVQLSKAMGYRVAGVVGSSHKLDYVKNLGADLVVDKSKNPNGFWDEVTAFAPEGYDVAFDANGFSTYQKSFDVLRSTGKLIAYGSHDLLPQKGGKLNYVQAVLGLLRTPSFKPLNLISENKGVIGFNVSFLFERQDLIEDIVTALYDLADQGLIKPIASTFIPFKKVSDAHKLIESGQSTGKIILKI